VGYVFFLPASIVGPVFEFSDYQNYLYRRENYAKVPSPLGGMLK
jgi:D-alanyl-lipoteichoic acid acyltransferase DltB (MBOAT superfamily)